VREVARRGARQLVLLRARRRGGYSEKRRLRRVTPAGALVFLGRPEGEPLSARVLDMNEEVVRVQCEHGAVLPSTEAEFLLDIPVRGRTCAAHRSARCTATVLERGGAPLDELLLFYRPSSPRSEYVIHQYFLHGSLVAPRREWRGKRPPFEPAVLGPARRPVVPAPAVVLPALPTLRPAPPVPGSGPDRKRTATAS